MRKTKTEIKTTVDTSTQTPIEIALQIDENGRTSNMTKLYREQILDYHKRECSKFSHITHSYEEYGFVYLMVCKKRCKIGISKDVSQRYTQIQQSLIDDDIEYAYVSPICSNKFDIETKFKKNFQQYNLRHEWFDIKHIDMYLKFLNNQIFKTEFLSIEELQAKEEKRKKEFDNWLNTIIPVKSSVNDRFYISTEETTKLFSICNDIGTFINSIIPSEISNIIISLCETYEISIQEFISLSIKEYLQKLIDIEMDFTIDDIQTEKNTSWNIFDELAAKIN